MTTSILLELRKAISQIVEMTELPEFLGPVTAEFGVHSSGSATFASEHLDWEVIFSEPNRSADPYRVQLVADGKDRHAIVYFWDADGPVNRNGITEHHAWQVPIEHIWLIPTEVKLYRTDGVDFGTVEADMNRIGIRV